MFFSVTFVDNHDSQCRGSALESQVESWLSLWHMLLYFIADGYPCIFYGDYYSLGDKESPHRWMIDKLLYTRKHYAYANR